MENQGAECEERRFFFFSMTAPFFSPFSSPRFDLWRKTRVCIETFQFDKKQKRSKAMAGGDGAPLRPPPPPPCLSQKKRRRHPPSPPIISLSHTPCAHGSGGCVGACVAGRALLSTGETGGGGGEGGEGAIKTISLLFFGSSPPPPPSPPVCDFRGALENRATTPRRVAVGARAFTRSGAGAEERGGGVKVNHVSPHLSSPHARALPTPRFLTSPCARATGGCR